MERATAPGLKWRPRKGGEPAAYWIATPAAVRAGYMPKSIRLSGTPAAIVARCDRLQAEMLQWLGRGTPAGTGFDGTWRALFDLYELDPESTFKQLKPGSRHPYLVYLGKLRAHVGARRISECDGRDVRRWFSVWSGGTESALGPHLAAACMALCVVKSALAYGIQCRKPGCAEFAAILATMEFQRPKARTEAPTAEQIEAARSAAHREGRPRRALAYALQFETILRQWDVIGQWFPLADPRASDVLGYGEKWFGLRWSHVGADNVIRYDPTKTEDTTEARVVIDLAVCPMVMAELAGVPEVERRGPVIVHEQTGLPYRYDIYRRGWRRDATAAGIPRKVWNRDLRAGGVTEARRAGASKDDLKKLGGHSERSRSAEVYDRAALEAHRRVAAARKSFREGDGK